MSWTVILSKRFSRMRSTRACERVCCERRDRRSVFSELGTLPRFPPGSGSGCWQFRRGPRTSWTQCRPCPVPDTSMRLRLDAQFLRDHTCEEKHIVRYRTNCTLTRSKRGRRWRHHILRLRPRRTQGRRPRATLSTGRAPTTGSCRPNAGTRGAVTRRYGRISTDSAGRARTGCRLRHWGGSRRCAEGNRTNWPCRWDRPSDRDDRAGAQRLFAGMPPSSSRWGSSKILRFPAGSFDVAMSTLILHHLPSDVQRRGLAEILYVLRRADGGDRRSSGPDDDSASGIAHRIAASRPRCNHARSRYACDGSGFTEIEAGPVRSVGNIPLGFVPAGHRSRPLRPQLVAPALR